MPVTHAIKGAKQPAKVLRSTMETMIVSSDEVNNWRIPPFQRPIRVNDKVMCMAEDIKKNACEISGVITLGRLLGETALYIVDGQHRIEAFRMSGLDEIIMDVRIVHFDTLAEMAEEFVQQNTALVRMRPDDILRGMTPTYPNLQTVLKECPFVSYDNFRRGNSSGPVLGLSATLRCWAASYSEAPASSSVAISKLAMGLDKENTETLIRFLHIAHDAWGRDPEYYRLWGNLNLALCMWLYRRLVLDTERRGTARTIVLNAVQFKQCLMALSASSNYVEWLTSRLLNDRDRSPCLHRIKAIFVRRLAESNVNKVKLPQPAWASA